MATSPVIPALYTTSDNRGYVALGANARAREREQHMVRTLQGRDRMAALGRIFPSNLDAGFPDIF
jgi:hypothetical protein